VASGMSIYWAFVICVLANMLVPPIVFIFLDTVHKILYRIKIYQRLFDRLVVRTRRKADRNVSKYGYWGIMLFVAIPLPITGAYTGTLAAWLLKLNKKKSFLYLALGVVIAGIIVSIATVTGVELFEIFLKK
jgi:uncharacterized membrane protein